ncbi:MAG: peptide deformylase [Bacilli bacterium]|nr:peptide deformylase [Bacilli bacterium]
MKLKIIKDSNPIMRKKSLPVDLPLSKEDKDTLDNMLNYLKLSQDEEYAKKHNIRSGVGLAAIQIGLLKRMFVIYYENQDNEIVQYQLVNPKIIETSIRHVALSNGEGCLSVDKDYKGLSHRYYKIKMTAFDALTNQDITITARGFDAIVLQHEYDHLDGIFFYDRIDKKNPNLQLQDEELI